MPLIVAAWLLGIHLASAKPIRLRNEPLDTPGRSEQSAAQSVARAEAAFNDGLALVQFTAALRPEWRAEIEALGVELLSYIPEDTYVADLNACPPGKLRKLEFVQWVGPYLPNHKLHSALFATNSNHASKSPLGEAASISVLVARRAKATDAQGARAMFRRVDQESHLRAGTILRGEIPRDQLAALAASRAVLWIEPAPKMRLHDEVASRIVAGDGPTQQTLMQSLGYDGAGVTVAVADSGLDSGETNAMHPDLQGRVRALFYYGTPGQLFDAADEHSHGTHVAGIIAGNGDSGETDENGFLYGLGVAPGAGIIGQRIFDGLGGYAPPPSFEKLTRDAKRAGADIGSNSWGDDTQGRYDLSAMEFDELVRDADALTAGDQPYILEFSAGNAGPGYQTVGSPAVAKNVIATGASQNERFDLPLPDFAIYDSGRDAMADFSSRGPCEDGRIKPDIVAPGTWIASLRSIYADDNNAWWPISQNYMYQGGTSQAGPHVSGAAAVFVQYWRAGHTGVTPSPALTKAALINSATDMDDFVETDAAPNADEGWGRVDLPGLIASSRSYDFVDQSVSLTNSAVYEKRILIGGAEEELKITLAYTDVPGSPAAGIALVNDLDLEVLAPDGHLYRGNRFNEDGESIPDTTIPDTINNVEGVRLLAPVPGEYVVRVRGSRVVDDARLDTPALDQDFALVISGQFGASGSGLVTFNQPVYRVPDTIRLALVDYDLAGQPTATLQLRSGAEPAGELVTLFARGSSGVFTGAIATASGSAAADGKLQIAHANNIEATYADAAPASNRVFFAQADLLPPVISNVRATNEFGQIAVTWNTDEDAWSEIYYGTNTPNIGITNFALDIDHEAGLVNVPAGAAARYFVVAQDVAGNRSTNNNGGNFFTITNTQPPEVLLIDSFTVFFGAFHPPALSGYTEPLDQLGISYNVFDATGGAIPSQAQLNAYRCVIWRVSDLEAPNATLAQRITNYVHNGGSLLLSSMEALSRFATSGMSSFNTGTLQVQSYIEDEQVDEVAGVSGEAIGNGINTPVDYSEYQEILLLSAEPDVPSDWITPSTNATAVLDSLGHIVGLRAPKTGVDLPGRVVFLSFPLDAVPLDSGIGNNRIGLLHNILNFLAPPANQSTLALDREAYSVPGRAVIEVEDADRNGQGTLTVTVKSPQHAGQLALTLTETARAGLFRGSIILSPTNSGLPGTFFVQANDSLTVDYFDASVPQTLTASATIETNAPTITDVAPDPGYLEAIISWTTSKPADGLIQYSETPDNFPKNFTAYDPALTTDHELVLTGLKPDTTYYFRVTSVDRAGNAAMADNYGTNFSFTTLLPLTPPWSDDMETNNVEWSTFSSTDSETEWTRGAPAGEAANSGTNCWGSILDGGSPGFTECYLISPGIYLSGGNKATLKFWQNYDFPDTDFDFEFGQVEIITNVFAPQIPIGEPLAFSSFGWEEVELDLTPYLGNVVYVVWHYALVSFDTLPRMGWLVDDVSITVTNIIPGTIQVSNNLWQAVWSLSGPSGRNGNGRWTAITNAAPGDYWIEYGSVPYFTTPPPQTNSLTTNGIITFSGQYTFPDANNNGIPDGWEIAQFGVIDPQRSRTTDTDRDGQSDYAEFVAGTDPLNPPSPFRLSAQLVNGQVKLSWPSQTNLIYRVHAAAQLPAPSWAAYSAWLPATGTNTSFTLPAATNGAPRFFRVEAASASGLAGSFATSIRRLSNNTIRLDWPAAPGHGYRLLGSTNGVNWSPFSDWMRPTAFTTGVTLPPRTNAAPNLFRVEAQP